MPIIQMECSNACNFRVELCQVVMLLICLQSRIPVVLGLLLGDMSVAHWQKLGSVP